MDVGFTVAAFKQYDSTGTAAPVDVELQAAKTGHAARMRKIGRNRRTNVSLTPMATSAKNALRKRHRQRLEVHDERVDDSS